MVSVGNIQVFLLLLVLANTQYSAWGAPQVPCFFIFGDSLVDNGNNNQLETLAKANYLPYGIDFPQGPTGRFTNGLTMADFLAQFLGFHTYIPPFATAQGKDILNGLNYASGSAGIRNETGKQLGENLGMDKQLLNHKVTISRISHLLGNETSAQKLLGKCLYYVGIGSNDYVNNYFIPDYYPTSIIYTQEQYATVLIQQYSHQLKTLYNLGARKISVFGLGPIGCIPGVMSNGTNGPACADSINDAVRLFNDKLKRTVKDLNHHTDAKFVYVPSIALAPSELFALGIKFLTEPCCQVSSASGGLCIPGKSPCAIRALHAFYDNFHPTEGICKVAATAAYPYLLKLIAA